MRKNNKIKLIIAPSTYFRHGFLTWCTRLLLLFIHAWQTLYLPLQCFKFTGRELPLYTDICNFITSVLLRYLQLIQLRLFLLQRISCWLLLLSFSFFGAFHRRIIRFDIWVQVSSEDGGRWRRGWGGVGWRSRALETWIPHESCQNQLLLCTAQSLNCILLKYTVQWG